MIRKETSSPRGQTKLNQTKAGKTKGKSDVAKTTGPTILTKDEPSKATLLRMLDLMIQARVLEERLIKLYKGGDSFFWLGSPGEEAFGVALGMHTLKGQGPEYDYLHLHYRATPTLLALGMPMIDAVRLSMNRATDPSTGGRNFCNHYCYPQWNVVPVTSVIEVQYGQAVGTAIAQRRRKSKGISIVTGGDAGSAEGDFAGCLIWSSRPEQELPIYITVQNNMWGISTPYSTQHGEKHVSDRGKAFGIPTRVVDGNDPIETYRTIEADMAYIRKTGKPVLSEFMVSRLYGHSSASGANRQDEPCTIVNFEKLMVNKKYITLDGIKAIWTKHDEEAKAAAEQARKEPGPKADTIWDHVYANGENADWRRF